MNSQNLKSLITFFLLIIPLSIIARDETHYSKTPITIDKKGDRTLLVTDGKDQILNMRVLSEQNRQLEVTKPIKGEQYNDYSYVIPAYVNIEGKIYTVMGIGNGAFAVKTFHMNTSTWHIEFPSTIKYIGDKAFCRLNFLESINLPDGLISIGEEAFWQCGMSNRSFSSIYIPKSVEYIGRNAFRTVSMNFSKSNGHTRAKIEGLPDFVSQFNCGDFGIDASAVRIYEYSSRGLSGQVLNRCIENENAKNKQQDNKTILSIISGISNITSQVSSSVATQEHKNKEVMADEFYGLTMDEYLNPSKISKEKMDKLIDPKMAIAKLNAIEQSHYDEFRRYCKKSDGSDYTYSEYKYLMYLQEQESSKDYISSSNNVEDYDDTDSDSDDASFSSSNSFSRRADDNSQKNLTTSNNSSRNRTSTKATSSKNTSREQFKTRKVSDDDYTYKKKVQLFNRDGSEAKFYCNGELYTKGAGEFIKVGSTYHHRMYSNWNRFSNQIVLSGGAALYYN